MQGRKERDKCIIGLWSRENRTEEVVVARERERERVGGGTYVTYETLAEMYANVDYDTDASENEYY